MVVGISIISSTPSSLASPSSPSPIIWPSSPCPSHHGRRRPSLPPPSPRPSPWRPGAPRTAVAVAVATSPPSPFTPLDHARRSPTIAAADCRRHCLVVPCHRRDGPCRLPFLAAADRVSHSLRPPHCCHYSVHLLATADSDGVPLRPVAAATVHADDRCRPLRLLAHADLLMAHSLSSPSTSISILSLHPPTSSPPPSSSLLATADHVIGHAPLPCCSPCSSSPSHCHFFIWRPPPLILISLHLISS